VSCYPHNWGSRWACAVVWRFLAGCRGTETGLGRHMVIKKPHASIRSMQRLWHRLPFLKKKLVTISF
jgi:hypothetical protein